MLLERITESPQILRDDHRASCQELRDWRQLVRLAKTQISVELRRTVQRNVLRRILDKGVRPGLAANVSE